jgi:5'-methylthioadenosine phosphorylase
MDVIGMTNMPEAKLAREAEICYATVAMCTDYDCWHSEEEDVDVASILDIMQANTEKAQRMLRAFFTGEQDRAPCPANCNNAMEHAILSDLGEQDEAAIKPVHALIKSYL